jgi:chromosomal replication initiator protein
MTSPEGGIRVNAKQIWQTTIERIQARVNGPTFNTWFAGTSALSYKDDVLVVSVPTTFAKAQLEDRFIEMVRGSLATVVGKAVEIQFVVAKENVDQDGNQEPALSPPKRLYRFAKGRLSNKKKHLYEGATPAMNSSALPATPRTNVHVGPEQGQSAEFSQVPLTMPVSPAPASPSTSFLDESVSAFQPPLQTGLMPFPGEGLLNPRYTFNTFIVGKSNQLAHAASLAVSENPGRIYNPLFLYGGVGLGKTHLLHAVGHVGEVAGLTVLYTTSEKFTNEIINAIRYQKTEDFRAKYRQIDILLVDDIQFIAGKESTEEEFFHTFNTLHDANKQIVVTSDRPPKAISSLQDRLRSRFEWGLLADVQPPEYEHRLAILRSKCESLHFVVPAAVIDYIARPAASSVRELEGALNRVIAYATLHDAPLSVSLAAQALENIYNSKRLPSATLSVTEVLEGVCRYYNVQIERIRGKQRDRESVWPRQVAMYLMREETSASLLQIGAELGGRDHTTIMHGWEKVHAEVKHNDRVRHEVAAVLESIQSRQL